MASASASKCFNVVLEMYIDPPVISLFYHMKPPLLLCTRCSDASKLISVMACSYTCALLYVPDKLLNIELNYIVDMDTELDTSHLIDVKTKLGEAKFNRAEWRELGEQLGLSGARMDEIQADHPLNNQRCYTECLNKWLQRVDNVDKMCNKKPTLSSLADALERMHRKDVAKALRKYTLHILHKL